MLCFVTDAVLIILRRFSCNQWGKCYQKECIIGSAPVSPCMFRAVRNSGQCMNQWNRDNEACNADYKNKNNELKDPKTKNC